MGLVRFLATLWISLLSTAYSRFRRGPLLPSWSFGFEAITGAQKRFNSALATSSPAAQRRAWGALEAKSPALSAVNVREEQLAGVRTLFYEPKTGKRSSVVLYLHGGSFVYGSEKSHGDLAARIALASGADVAFPLYRLAPEYPFPAAAEDVARVFAALAERHGAEQLVVAGDSAGGNLALGLLLGLRDAGQPLPRAAVPISPWVDLTAEGGSLERNRAYDWAEPEMFAGWARAYLGHGEDAARPEISPAHAKLHGLPPLFVLVGSAEMLHDQVVAFVDRVRAAGGSVRLHVGHDMPHLWLAHAPIFRSCQAPIDEIGAFVRETEDSRRRRGTSGLATA